MPTIEACGLTSRLITRMGEPLLAYPGKSNLAGNLHGQVRTLTLRLRRQDDRRFAVTAHGWILPGDWEISFARAAIVSADGEPLRSSTPKSQAYPRRRGDVGLWEIW